MNRTQTILFWLFVGMIFAMGCNLMLFGQSYSVLRLIEMWIGIIGALAIGIPATWRQIQSRRRK